MQGLHGNFGVWSRGIEKILLDPGSRESDSPEEVLSVIYEQDALELVLVREGIMADANMLR